MYRVVHFLSLFEKKLKIEVFHYSCFCTEVTVYGNKIGINKSRYKLYNNIKVLTNFYVREIIEVVRNTLTILYNFSNSLNKNSLCTSVRTKEVILLSPYKY